MKTKTKKLLLVVVCAVVLVALSVTLLAVHIMGSEPAFTGSALAYYNELKEKGFPADYAESLTRVHLLHPTWSFEMLSVSRSWSDTVELETKNEKTNLILGSDAYSAYRHKTNTAKYDSGYYQASTATVSYFMDARNFLNECDLFQFYEQTPSENLTVADLDAVLADTFMENALLENGKTYAEYLLEVGNEVGINPVFLAVRLRQEQGTGSSPLLTGKCGTLLAEYYVNQTETTESGKTVNPPEAGTVNVDDLKALDGYYNLFNIRASGTGVFNIYRNAMNYAKEQGWDTKWKALRGGAIFLQSSYIAKGQSTLYLQKFDVLTTGSLHQYMQNVAGAFSEGRILYRFFAENGLCDSACTFLIPVYTDLPSKACADPAKGNCATYAKVCDRYDYTVTVTSPISDSAKNDAVFGTYSVNYDANLTVSGTISHDCDIIGYEYAWDFGEWETLTDSDGFSISVPADELPEWGNHILTVRACHAYKKTNLANYTLCLSLDVTVVPPPEVSVTMQDKNGTSVLRYRVGDFYTLPDCADKDFAGYLSSDDRFLPSEYAVMLSESVTFRAVFLPITLENGASLYIGDVDGNMTKIRFDASVGDDFTLLDTNFATFSAVLTENQVMVRSICQTDDETGLRHFQICSEDLTVDDKSNEFSVIYKIELHYSNGTEKLFYENVSSVRTPAYVASMALSDTETRYSDCVKNFLQQFIV